MQGLTIEDTAKLLHVSVRTVLHWESGDTRIPYAAFKLLHILSGFELPGSWQGWCIKGDTLWSPVNRPFRVFELNHLTHYLTMARFWQADYARRILDQQQADSSTTRSVVAVGLRLVK